MIEESPVWGTQPTSDAISCGFLPMAPDFTCTRENLTADEVWGIRVVRRQAKSKYSSIQGSRRPDSRSICRFEYKGQGGRRVVQSTRAEGGPGAETDRPEAAAVAGCDWPSVPRSLMDKDFSERQGLGAPVHHCRSNRWSPHCPWSSTQ